MTISYTPNINRYFLLNDDGRSIAYFDSLAKAGLVLRYLQGADMPADDCALAVNVMRNFDREAKARAAEQDAKRAARRQAKQQPAQPPETPIEALEGGSPGSERTEPDESGQNEG